MKLGILTFHRASNYGAVLQCFALQETLTRLGYDAPVVDYRTPQVELDHWPKHAVRKAGLIRGVSRIPRRMIKTHRFDAFRKRALSLTDEIREADLPSLINDFDGFIAGSDQVWSERYAALDSHLFLDFARDGQRYSYACSFGADHPGDAVRRACTTYLPSFEAVSLREMSGQTFVKDEVGVPARTDVDPVLLLQRDDWLDFASLPSEEGYILIYTVPGPVHLLDVARSLSARTGKKIVYLNDSLKHRDLPHRRLTTPEEFVGWFARAGIVLTNSFHGTAFSTLLGKDFFVEIMSDRGQNNRSLEFLKSCGLSNRILTMDNGQDLLTPIDWNTPQSRLAALRDPSINYLKGIGSHIVARQKA
ncbi:MAG: polysaccharide pyruvyl transferase family protein [Atopobiaceae bacterium]|nr:polysaccharide pyruvyl transferase family protein [Atopobiaceae bacterium]